MSRLLNSISGILKFSILKKYMDNDFIDYEVSLIHRTQVPLLYTKCNTAFILSQEGDKMVGMPFLAIHNVICPSPALVLR